MGVNRNLVVCLVVALLYSSLTPVSDPPIDNPKKQPLSYTDSALDLAMKIQLPGSEWQDNSVIEWSPADFEENRLMQFSVRLSNNVNFDTITDISVSLVSLEDVSSHLLSTLEILKSMNLLRLKMKNSPTRYTLIRQAFHKEIILQ